MANPAPVLPAREPASGKFVKPPEPKPDPTPPDPKADPAKAKAEQAGMETFFKHHLKKEPPKPEEKKPEDTKPPAPKPKPRRQPTSAPAPRAEDITKAVVEGVKQAIAPKPEPKAPEPKLDEGLADDEKETLGVLQEMAAIAPEKYKETAKKYAEGQRALNEYAKNWQQQNPGAEFNLEDDEHATFVQEHNPDWADTDFEKAKASLFKKQIREEVTKELSPEIDEIKQKARLSEAAPIISKETFDAARKYWDLVSEETKGVISPDGKVNDEILDKMQKADPDAYEQMIQKASDLNHEIRELRLLFPMDDKTPPLAKFNPANPVHRAIDKFGVELERDILTGPEEEKTNSKGQAFMPSERYWQLPAEQRDQYWTLTYPGVRQALIEDRAEQVKKGIKDMEEKLSRFAQRRNMVPAGGQSNGGARQPAPRVAPLPAHEREVKPDGPGSQSTSRMAATQRQSATDGKTAESSFLNHHFGRKS